MRVEIFIAPREEISRRIALAEKTILFASRAGGSEFFRDDIRLLLGQLRRVTKTLRGWKRIISPELIARGTNGADFLPGAETAAFATLRRRSPSSRSGNRLSAELARQLHSARRKGNRVHSAIATIASRWEIAFDP